MSFSFFEKVYLGVHTYDLQHSFVAARVHEIKDWLRDKLIISLTLALRGPLNILY